MSLKTDLSVLVVWMKQIYMVIISGSLVFVYVCVGQQFIKFTLGTLT
jgi:hypothetical protein